MKTLHLLRHAKSGWDDPDMPDHDRPLAPRGARAATLIGRHLLARGFHPDLILCSTAKRAGDTLDLVLSQLGGGVEELPFKISRERGLYLCGERALLHRLRQLPDDVTSVLLVAHNPDLQYLTRELAGTGDEADLRSVAGKFPTGALAELTFDIHGWSDIGPRTGTLLRLVLPKNLT
ncbi:phosphohistidine phosphatase [Skermanella stibiiresistens SB22]|uniref:Phosphohistidine phosphatase n=1 Tax=Skermanella stibiiresistens SB22 TaxID=1385369 RepID=W9H831_9PROT|nr:histidine phosphatase family protein [Skermanella stibiiresistens]EWY39963.1 phosphohistidine phosphatase [Skermanella stibiiresistens SB22]